jgi:hypothetical protein
MRVDMTISRKKPILEGSGRKDRSGRKVEARNEPNPFR